LYRQQKYFLSNLFRIIFISIEVKKKKIKIEEKHPSLLDLGGLLNIALKKKVDVWAYLARPIPFAF